MMITLRASIGAVFVNMCLPYALFAETTTHIPVGPSPRCAQDSECVIVQCGCGWRVLARADAEGRAECQALSAVVECLSFDAEQAGAQRFRARCRSFICELVDEARSVSGAPSALP